MIRRLASHIAWCSPVLLAVLLTVTLSVMPVAIMGLALFRTTHRLATAEAAIVALQGHDQAKIRDLHAQASDVARRLAAGEVDQARLTAEIAGIADNLAALESRIDAQGSQQTAAGGISQGKPPGAESTPNLGEATPSRSEPSSTPVPYAPRSESRCLIPHVALCASANAT